MKTYSTRMGEVKHAWHVLDATDQPLGRLATQAAALLRGKHKPIYQPNLPVGDFVVIVNAEKVRVTGNKVEGKVYYRHTQYPGGLRQTTYRHQMEKFPTRAVEKAVKGMLPHNRLGRKLFTRLKVYAGPEHPHGAQVAEGAKPHVPRARPQRPARVATPPDETAAAVTAAATTAAPSDAPPETEAEAPTTTATAMAAPTAPETAAAPETTTAEAEEIGAGTAAAAAPPTTIAETAVPEESPDTPETAPAPEE
jgi:large subunit ribosomal protein L13